MYKLGLKLWSTNQQYIDDAIRLYKEKLYDYMELFVVPGSFKDYLPLWKRVKIPYVIHASHSAVGLNLSKQECFKNNIKLSNEAKRFADELGAEIIIFHPGVDGKIKETISQLKKIKDSRFVIENKPYYAIYDNLVCVGHSPVQIKQVIKEVGVGFCCDIGHAIYAANAQKIDPMYYLEQFLSLSPCILHISDGDFYGTYDEHKNLGKGTFDFKKIVNILPTNKMISIETTKKFQDRLDDFQEDVLFLRKRGINGAKR